MILIRPSSKSWARDGEKAELRYIFLYYILLIKFKLQAKLLKAAFGVSQQGTHSSLQGIDQIKEKSDQQVKVLRSITLSVFFVFYRKLHWIFNPTEKAYTDLGTCSSRLIVKKRKLYN